MKLNKETEQIKEMELRILKICTLSSKNNIELSITYGSENKILKYPNEQKENVITPNDKIQIPQFNDTKLQFHIKTTHNKINSSSSIYVIRDIPLNEIIKSQLSKDFNIEFILIANNKPQIEMKPLLISSLTKLQSEEIQIDQAQDCTDSFCESFFIASLPQQNAQMIQNSNAFPSQCLHRICTSFPAYQPEIINRYPFEDKNHKRFTLNNLIATLCFPYGIKICFGQRDSVIPEQKTFMTVTTNELGKRNYIYVYSSFLKMDFIEFKSKYDCDPIKDYLLKAKIVHLLENCKDQKFFQDQIQADFELSQTLIDSVYVYIPIAYCLVSKHPYENQMKICIESLLQLKDANEQKTFLKHLIYEIPIPSNDSRLYFYVPYNVNLIEIYGKNSEGLTCTLNSLSLLLEYFSNEMLVKIFTLMLFEQKILLVSNDFGLLTRLTMSLINVIYPLRWSYNYIPVLCYNILKILQAFVPFIMGISKDLFPYAKEYFDEDCNIFIIHLKENRKSIIKMSQSYMSSSKHNKSKVPIAPFDKEIPNEIRMELIQNLEANRKDVMPLSQSLSQSQIASASSSNQWSNDKKIRKSFIKCLCKLFGDYKRYVSIIDHNSYFNIEAFIQEKTSNTQFYIDLVSTGLFQSFIQSNNSFGYFTKYSLRYGACPFKPVKRKGTSIHMQLNDLKNLLTESNIRKTKTNTNTNITLTDSDSSTLNASNQSGSKKSFNYFISPYFLRPLINSNEIQEAMIAKYNGNKSNTNTNTIEDIITSNTNVNSNANVKTGNSIKIIYSAPYINKGDNTNEEYSHHKYIIPSGTSNSKTSKSTDEKSIGNVFDEKIIRLEDTMKALLTGNKKLCREPITNNDFISPEIRHAFSTMIYQDKFAHSNSHALDPKSFSELSHLVFSALVYGIKDYNEGRLITKSLFHYYKRTSQKQKHFLYQIYDRKKPFDIWVDEQFWFEWFTNEYKQKEINGFDNNNSNNAAFMTITEIASIMNDLNIDINFQLYCLKEKIATQVIKNDNELNEALEVTMIKQYNYRKQVQAS